MGAVQGATATMAQGQMMTTDTVPQGQVIGPGLLPPGQVTMQQAQVTSTGQMQQGHLMASVHPLGQQTSGQIGQMPQMMGPSQVPQGPLMPAYAMQGQMVPVGMMMQNQMPPSMMPGMPGQGQMMPGVQGQYIAYLQSQDYLQGIHAGGIVPGQDTAIPQGTSRNFLAHLITY